MTASVFEEGVKSSDTDPQKHRSFHWQSCESKNPEKTRMRNDREVVNFENLFLKIGMR